VIAQTIGGCIGAVIANVMFSLPAFDLSTKARSSGALWLSEVIATVGLLLVIHGCVRTGRASVVPFAVGLWIGGAYFFTSSTSFANPAVTVARHCRTPSRASDHRQHRCSSSCNWLVPSWHSP